MLQPDRYLVTSIRKNLAAFGHYVQRLSFFMPFSILIVKVKSFAPRQIQRRLFAALVTLSRKVF